MKEVNKLKSNLFTTYNSVDPPGEQFTPIYTPTQTTINNPLYELLNKVSSSKEDTLLEETTSSNKFFDKEYIEESTKEEKLETSSSNVKKSLFKDLKLFVDTMRPIYSKILKEKGLDEKYADYLVALTALESAWGKKLSGKNNLGGIKVPSKQRGKGLGTIRRTREVINGKDVYIDAEFRDFKDLEDYAKFHVNLLNNMNYLAFNGDFIANVVRGGYATDPNYRKVLSNIYNQIKV